MEMVDVEFSYQDPPYKVRQAFDGADERTRRACSRSRRRSRRRSATATTASSTASSIERLEEDRWPVKNELVTRIWYMAQRHGFTLPYPVHVALQHQQERPFSAAAPGARICSRSFRDFQRFPA